MTSAEIRPLRDDEVATYVELRDAIDPRTATMPGWVEQHRRSETTVRIVLAHEGDDVAGVGSAQEEADVAASMSAGSHSASCRTTAGEE